MNPEWRKPASTLRSCVVTNKYVTATQTQGLLGACDARVRATVEIASRGTGSPRGDAGPPKMEPEAQD